MEEDEKRKKRLERFGGGTLSAPTDAKTVKLTALADVNIDVSLSFGSFKVL